MTEKPNSGDPPLDSSANQPDIFHSFRATQLTDPRKETLPQALHSNFCPHITLLSFAIFMSILLFTFFIIQLAICGIRGNGSLLEINRVKITQYLETSRTSLIIDKNVFKPLLSWLIHQDLPQILGCLILWVTWASWSGPFFGPIRSFFIFILSSYIGFLFGGLFLRPGEALMGSAFGLAGLLASGLGFALYHWHDISNIESRRIQFYLMICVVVSLGMVFASTPAAAFAQLFAAFGGMFLGMVLSLGTKPEGRARHWDHQKLIAVLGVFCFSVLLLFALIMVLLLCK